MASMVIRCLFSVLLIFVLGVPAFGSYVEYGWASWYGGKFNGRRTSSGIIYNMYDMVAAHRTLPFGTYVEVTNLSNKRKVVVKIIDRGPFKKNRIIDLSYAAAKKLRMIGPGTAYVKLVVVRASGRIPSVMKRQVLKGVFGAQVGAFSSLGRAKIWAVKIRELIWWHIDVPVFIRRGYKGVKPIYRVFVGKFSRPEDAAYWARYFVHHHIEAFTTVVRGEPLK